MSLGSRLPVVVDGRALYDGSEHRGLGTYAWNILAGLASTVDLDVSVLAPSGTPLPSGIRLQPVKRRLTGRFARFEHDMLLPREIEQSGGQVFFGPAQHPPRRCSIPWIQCFHDAIPMLHPDLFPLGERVFWYRRRGRFRRADAVLSLSHHASANAIKFLRVSPAAAHVIYPGVNVGFKPDQRSGGEPPYLLCIGPWAPHKRIEAAMEVVARVADAGLPHRLKITGWADSWVRAQVDHLRGAARRPELVDVLGYVDDLAPVYQAAAAVLVTSRAEGFGLPAVEAMACGTPVIAFDNSALHEVVEGAGILVRDGDVDEMARQTLAVLLDPATRSAWRTRGLARSAMFSWPESARLHAQLMRRVAAR